MEQLKWILILYGSLQIGELYSMLEFIQNKKGAEISTPFIILVLYS